jgi:type II secretory pathway component PulF
VVRAASREEAGELLHARGLFPLEVAAEQASARARATLPVHDLALGLRVLATLAESGLPIARVLAAMDDLAPTSWKAGLPAIRESVRQGGSLAAALSSSPLGFPPVVVGMVAAGEAGSGLARAVRRAAELMERAAETRRAVRAALAYPLVLAGAGGVSLILLVGVVLPRFAVILADLGQELPPMARAVLAVSAAVRAWWVPALLLLAGVLAAWRLWVSSSAGARRWDALLLSIPAVGAVRLAGATARFTASLAALLESGVPIAPAMLSSARAAGDAAVEGRVLRAREAVVGGEGVGRALEATGALTPTALRLVRAGEETGQLGAMLAHASRIESERAADLVRGAVRLLEPSLIIAFGGVVAVVAGALLQAVYSVRPGP